MDEIAVADAHPLGARPFQRADYVAKFRTLASGILESSSINAFIDLAERLPELTADELGGLTVMPDPAYFEGLTVREGLL